MSDAVHIVVIRTETGSGLGKFWGSTVVKIGYTITEAARVAGVEVRDIEVAVSTGHLVARRALCLGKDRAIVLHDDIHAWLDTMPAWLG